MTKPGLMASMFASLYGRLYHMIVAAAFCCSVVDIRSVGASHLKVYKKKQCIVGSCYFIIGRSINQALAEVI